MGIWNRLFRRISSKKDKNGGGSSSKTTAFPVTMHTKRNNQNDASGSVVGGRRVSSGSIQRRKSTRESKKLIKRQKRAYSFSPGRNDIIQVPKDVHRQHPVPPLPPNLDAFNAKGAINTERGPIDQESRKRNRAASQAQLEGQSWERVPTLHKRSGQELDRRKSSKKRKEEHDREAEIRAMSASMPSKKQAVRMRSDVSLHPSGSVKSTQSANDEHHTSYKVAALDILTPHPTIRYAENPRYGRAVSSDHSRKKRVSDRVRQSEDILKSHKRVDDLVEEMDASELRELMERDKRRREKKQIEEQIKLERRLARRKARQDAEQAQAVENGTGTPKNTDRGVLGRELEGTDVVETSTIRRNPSTASERKNGKRPAENGGEDPFDSTRTKKQVHTEESVPAEESLPAEQREEAIAILSPPMSPPSDQQANLHPTQSMDLDSGLTSAPSDKSTKASTDRRESDVNVRQHQSWTSFFRRTKNRRISTDTPSSFSNTSRDSIPNRAELPIQMPPIPLVRQVSSGVPKRTKSKFREDLPELPMSPPDSRNVSPEVDVVPPMHSNYPEKLPAGRGSSDSPHLEPSQRRYDTPTSGLISGHRSVEVPSPEPTAILSQSLASIGSEGSWLSGKAGGLGSKRASMVPPYPLRDSASSLQKRYREYSESTEELGIAEDAYFSRLTPGLEEDPKVQGQDNQSPVSDDDDESLSSPTRWHAAVAARQPQVVHHDTRVVKSREGLLRQYLDDAPVTPDELSRKSYAFDDATSPISAGPDSPEAVITQATSMAVCRAPVRQISNASTRSKKIVEEG